MTSCLPMFSKRNSRLRRWMHDCVSHASTCRLPYCSFKCSGISPEVSIMLVWRISSSSSDVVQLIFSGKSRRESVALTVKSDPLLTTEGSTAIGVLLSRSVQAILTSPETYLDTSVQRDSPTCWFRVCGHLFFGSTVNVTDCRGKPLLHFASGA